MSGAAQDVVVIGGGITGLSVAVHAARRELAVTLVEAQAIGGVSTQRSGALVRTHYDDPASAALALRGLELFESFEAQYGGPSGFTATGFAYVPEAHELESGAFAARLAMLRRVGIEIEAVDVGELAAIDPSIDLSDVGVAAYEPRSGFADPATTTATLAAAARAAGASLLEHTAVLRVVTDGGGAVCGVELIDAGAAPGTSLGSAVARGDAVDSSSPAGVSGAASRVIEAENVVLCSGAWSPVLASAVGVELPIRPTAVKLAFVDRAVPHHLTVIDAPGGIYVRPDPSGSTLVGRRTWTDEPLAGPDAPLPDVDDAFLADAAARLARRLPSAAGARVVGSRAGMLDMTPDGLPLVGPALLADGAGAPGLWLCCGWSGTGFKTGPPVGEALAEWIATGRSTLDLASYATDRPFDVPAAAVRSPH